MNIAVLIAFFVVLIPLAGIFYAAFEKFLNHRAEIARIKYGSKGQANAELVKQVETLRAQILALKERQDEQAILIDDLSRLRPILAQGDEDGEQVPRLRT